MTPVAAAWLAAHTLSGPSTFIDDPTLVFSGNGRALATWSWQDGIRAAARSGVRVATRLPGATAFEREMRGPRLATAPAAYGSGRAVVLERRALRDGRERLSARFGETAGGFARGHTLARASLAGVPALAAAGNGYVVAAWIERRRDRRIVLVATRVPGGRFSRARVVRGTGRADTVSAAIGDGGSLVVAWARQGRIEARVRMQGHASGFGPVTALGKGALGSETRIVSAISARRRVYVAWSSRQLSEGGEVGPFTVHAAVRPAGPNRFRPAQELERAAGAQPQEARIALDLDQEGGATLAWTAAQPVMGASALRFVARVAQTDWRARFGPAQTVSPTDQDAAVSDVAVSGTGEALVVWSALDAVQEVGEQVWAVRRPATAASFLAPEAVSPPTERARVPAGAYDPRTGVPTVVWSARIGADGPGVPIADVRTYARAATRDATRRPPGA